MKRVVSSVADTRGYEIGQSQGRQSVSQSDCRSERAARTRSKGRERERAGKDETLREREGTESERRENAWQAFTGSISRGKDKFLIGPRYTGMTPCWLTSSRYAMGVFINHHRLRVS